MLLISLGASAMVFMVIVGMLMLYRLRHAKARSQVRAAAHENEVDPVLDELVKIREATTTAYHENMNIHDEFEAIRRGARWRNG